MQLLHQQKCCGCCVVACQTNGLSAHNMSAGGVTTKILRVSVELYKQVKISIRENEEDQQKRYETLYHSRHRLCLRLPRPTKLRETWILPDS